MSGEKHILTILPHQTKTPNLSQLRRKTTEKHKTTHMIIYEYSDNLNETILQTLLQRYFLEFNFLNVVAIIWQNDSLQIIGYCPFRDRLIPLHKHRNIFYNKLQNIHQYPLRISLFPDPGRIIQLENGELRGPEALVVDEIARIMNATIKYVPLSDESRYDNLVNGSYGSGSLKQVIFDEVDISLNLRFLMSELWQLELAEVISLEGHNDIKVIVPNIDQNFNIDFTIIWTDIVLIVVHVCIMILLILFYNVFSKLLSTAPIESTWLNFFAWYFNQPYRLPTKIAERIYVLFWIIYTMIHTVYFYSLFMSNLTVPYASTPIKTMADLVDSNYTIYVTQGMYRILDNYLSFTKSRVQFMKKLEIIKTTDFYRLIDEPQNNTAVYLSGNLFAQFATITNVNEVGLPIYYIMPEEALIFWVTYIAPFGSPYLSAFNRIVESMTECGFYKLWTHQFRQNYSKPLLFNTPDPVGDYLTYKTLMVFFCEYLIGMAFACLVFVMEICYFKINKIMRRRRR